MNKRKSKKRKANQGNSFLVVIATISFLSVLTTAMLVAVALCYRLKAYDINSRDNFYYLERAMDKIYEGVGSISMKHLNEAYNETTDKIVYYDIDKKSYITLSNEEANQLMRSAFLLKIGKDENLQTAKIKDTLENLIRDEIDNHDVQLLSVGNVSIKNESMTIENITLKREAMYSTVSTYKETDPNKTAPGAETFVQSITTDLIIAPPDFEVDFNSMANDELYDYAMIADMGVEIEGLNTKSDINGNIYAASDFYNKEYLYKDDLNVSKYKDGDKGLEAFDGIKEKSMYSGFYINQAKVSIMADRMIVPGSVAAMNCSKLSMRGSRKDTNLENTELWADNIILGGYSRKSDLTKEDSRTGSEVKIEADTYVSDDLELNAKGSDFTLEGNYYGYSDGTKDNRIFSAQYLKTVTGNKNINKRSDFTKTTDGNYIDENGDVLNLPGQSHYNSSSIVINGENSSLDLSKLNNLYLAGQAYVEMSKSKRTTTYSVQNVEGQLQLNPLDIKDDDLDADATATDENGIDTISQEEYKYNTESDDNYSMVRDQNGTYTKERIQDYETGESLSIKSNQLAYIPPYLVHDVPGDNNLYVTWPSVLKDDDYFGDLWETLEQVPVVKTVTGGKTYYFYDFSRVNPNKFNDKDNKFEMDEYIRKYAKLFENDPNDGSLRTLGDLADFYDITADTGFTVKSIKLDEDKSNIYSNSAISIKEDTETKIKVIDDQKNTLDLMTNDAGAAPINSVVLSNNLRSKFKSMKMLLTDKPNDTAASLDVDNANETAISPINTYFDFRKLNQDVHYKLDTNYHIYVSDGDVEIKDPNAANPNSDGRVMGVVLCKGNVTFDKSVKEFDGLIVSGGKIQVDHSVNFVANREIVKAVLNECDQSSDPKLNNVCDVCTFYEKMIKKTEDPNVIAMKSVSAVLFEDVLAYDHWKKNVK